MRILIAEDEPVSRLRLGRLLERWGYQVTAVADGEEAWQALCGDDAPSLAILDWQMPGRDGVSLCRALREREDAPYVYILLLTALTDTANLVEAMNAGADDYLSKPFEPHELEARLLAGQRILRSQRELIETRETLREQATRDDLTGAWNRRAVRGILDRELSRTQRGSGRGGLGVLIADLDRFKEVNDRHGHLVGDDVLCEVARRLGRQVRRYDSLGRLGGDEFVILLADCDRSQVAAAAERIRCLVAQHAVETPAGALPVTVSLGATWVPNGRRVTAREALSSADRALYAAKAEGRNQLCFDRQIPGAERPSADGLLFFDGQTPEAPAVRDSSASVTRRGK